MSYLLTMLIFAYAAQKYLVMADRKDTYIMASEQVNKYTYETKFTEAQNLKFAAGFSSYYTGTENEEDESYARLVMQKYGWGEPDSKINMTL